VSKKAPEPKEGMEMGCPRLYIRMGQEELNDLKRLINQAVPVKLTRFIEPVSLFNEPLDIVREEIIQEFRRTHNTVQNRPEKVNMQKTKFVNEPYRECKQVEVPWDGPLGVFFTKSREECNSGQRQRPVVYNEDEIVHKQVTFQHQTFEKKKITYARRFDKSVGIYAIESLGEHTESRELPK